jgi:hypothetical protein
VASEPRAPSGPPLVARVELVSDDSPVEVYVVTGTREQLQFVTVPTAPSPTTMGFGLGMPFAGSAMIAPIGSTNYAPSEIIEARTTVEQRRFLCTTPCAVSLPEGPLSLHLRTLGAALGTETVQLRPGATRFRVRTAATGLYTLGQALLWVGAGLAVTGASLIVQSQTGCGAGGCTPWPGALTTGAGVLSMAIGIPLVVLYSRRLEAIGARSVAVGPGVVRLAF